MQRFLRSKNNSPEVAVDNDDICGEGILWDVVNQRLLWVDIDRSYVFQLDLESGMHSRISENLPASAIVSQRDGGLVFAGNPGIHLWYSSKSYLTIATRHDHELLIYNDMIADSVGRLYAGTIYWGGNGMEKMGKLYRIDCDGSVHTMDEGIELSNGLGFSPDNQTLYFTDSSARRIYSYDVDTVTGDLSSRKTFVRVPRNEGIPDGLTVDAAGYIWSAQWYSGRVVRYDPTGSIDQTIDLPAKQVSNVTFGGPDLTDLYITSASKYWPSHCVPKSFNLQSHMGGELYRVRTNVQGKADHACNLKITA